VDVRVDPGRIARMLRLRGGIVERRLAARTRRVADIARTLAPGSMPAYIDWRIEEAPEVSRASSPATTRRRCTYLRAPARTSSGPAGHGLSASRPTAGWCSRTSCTIQARGRTTSSAGLCG